MHRENHRSRASGLLLAALIVAPLFVLRADEPAEKPDADLPDVDTIIAQMIEAEGGKEAMAKVRSRKTTGDLEFAGMGMSAKLESWNGGDRKYRSSMTIEGFGSFDQGILGDLAWSNDPVQGARILEGVEAEMMTNDAELHPKLAVKTNYPEIRVVEKTEVGGTAAYHLELTSPSGNKMHWYVGADDGLLKRAQSTVTSPQIGRVKIAMEFDDFREVDGLLLAHGMTIQQGPQTLKLRVSKVEHNVEVPADKFELPEDVSKLVEKRGGAEGEAGSEGAKKTPEESGTGG